MSKFLRPLVCDCVSDADETNDVVDQLHAVVKEQRQEIDYLQNLLENLTAQRNADDMHGWLFSFCCSIIKE